MSGSAENDPKQSSLWLQVTLQQMAVTRSPRRHFEPERVRRTQIDHELELGRLQDRLVGRLLALEDAGRCKRQPGERRP
jgi:hypothetical protein